MSVRRAPVLSPSHLPGWISAYAAPPLQAMLSNSANRLENRKPCANCDEPLTRSDVREDWRAASASIEVHRRLLKGGSKVKRLVVFAALTLAISDATAQAPVALTGGGSPIAVPPIQIGPPYDGSGAAFGRRVQEQELARQPVLPRPSPSPVPLSNCNGGGCWDSQGNLYNSTGDGSRFVSPEGKLCQTNGKFIYCN